MASRVLHVALVALLVVPLAGCFGVTQSKAQESYDRIATKFGPHLPGPVRDAVKPALPPEARLPAPDPNAEVPPVLFFYYVWHSAGKEGRHWSDGITGEPKLGYYDSRDLNVARIHFQQIRNAGAAGVVISWWGSESYEEHGLAVLVEAAELEDMKIAATFETMHPDFNDEPPEVHVEQLRHLWQTYAQSPAWLRVDGKPVVYVHGACLRSVEHWDRTFDLLAKEGVEFHAYGEVRKTSHARYFPVFAGLYIYNPIEPLRDGTYRRVNAEMQELADAAGKEWIVTMAGQYDNKNDKLARAYVRVPWDDGRLLRDSWETALRHPTRYVMVTTWNEWNEGSTFEPGDDGGERLRLLSELITRGRG